MSTSPPTADGAGLAAAEPGRPDALARFVTPARPDAAMLEQLHRGHDGFVSFGRKEGDGQWRDLFAVRADELAAMFPRLAEWLTADAYFTINATYRPGYGRSAADGRLPRACHRSTALRWLTACFVDLDTAHSPHGLTDGQAVGALIDAQDRGVVPPASIIVRSGRGLWALWVLHADDGGGPVRAWPEKIDAWRRAQRRIGQLFAALAADPAARDACRVMRVPGSLNTKARRRVNYWIQTDAAGKPFRYSLPELCGALGVPVRSLYAAARAVCSEAARERGQRGTAGRWAKALRQFETLRALRGGFRQGTRARACFVLACILRGRKLAQAEIVAHVRRLAAECLDADGRHPDPLPEHEADDACALGMGPGSGRIRNDTIADRLDVTPEEAAQLESWPAASRFSTGRTAPDDGDRLTKPERAERRRALIADLLRAARGRVPTLAAIRGTLDTAGLPATARTVAKDLIALGVRNPRARDRDGSQLALATVAIPRVSTSKLIGGGATVAAGPCPDPVPRPPPEAPRAPRPVGGAAGGPVGSGADPVPSPPCPPPEAAREARRPEAPPSPTERAPREAQRPERRAVTTGVPTDAPRVQTAIPGEAEVPVPDLEAEDRERETGDRIRAGTGRYSSSPPYQLRSRHARDRYGQEIHTGNHPDHTQDTPEARPEAPESTPRRRPPPMTPDQRREKRAAARVALAVGRLEDEHEQRMAALRVDDQTFAAEVAGALELLEHLDGLTARRQTAAP